MGYPIDQRLRPQAVACSFVVGFAPARQIDIGLASGKLLHNYGKSPMFNG